MQALMKKVKRFREIGQTIADLSEESKRLRKEIAEDTDRLKLGRIKINESEPVEFLIGNSHISVKQSGKDFTILCKDLKQVSETNDE